MPRKRKIKRWKKPSANPLNNLNLSEYTNPEKVKAKQEKEENYKSFQKEYERLLHREVRREDKAYRVVYKNHPDLLFVAFAQDREKAKYQSARYFKSAYHPFFTGEDYRKEMLKSHAYRCQELDKYAFEGTIPISELLKVLQISMPCSVCGKDHFDYSDYDIGRCFIVEGEGNLNPFTRGYILCYDCHKKYIQNK